MPCPDDPVAMAAGCTRKSLILARLADSLFSVHTSGWGFHMAAGCTWKSLIIVRLAESLLSVSINGCVIPRVRTPRKKGFKLTVIPTGMNSPKIIGMHHESAKARSKNLGTNPDKKWLHSRDPFSLRFQFQTPPCPLQHLDAEFNTYPADWLPLPLGKVFEPKPPRHPFQHEFNTYPAVELDAAPLGKVYQPLPSPNPPAPTSTLRHRVQHLTLPDEKEFFKVDLKAEIDKNCEKGKPPAAVTPPGDREFDFRLVGAAQKLNQITIKGRLLTEWALAVVFSAIFFFRWRCLLCHCGSRKGCRLAFRNCLRFFEVLPGSDKLGPVRRQDKQTIPEGRWKD